MNVRRNLAFGLASAGWSALVGLAVIPLQLRFLGIEAYGLVGVYASAYALCALLDFGLAPAITREVARCSATNNIRPVRELLHTLSFVYWAVAAAIALAALICAPVLARGWFSPTQMPQESIRTAIALIGVVLACRWPQGLYLGALFGSERMVIVSVVAMGMAAVSGLGGVAVLAWVSPTIEAFFIWQAAAGLLHVLVLRAITLRVIGRDHEVRLRFSLSALKSTWRFSAGLSGIALTALFLTQIDKVILSGLLTLSSFGEYTLATTVVSSVYLIVNPVFNLIYPRFTALAAKAAHSELAEFYRSGTWLLAAALFPLCMTMAVFAKELLFIWTGNQQIADDVSGAVSMLVAGAALHSVMYFPYAIQLAFGNTRLPLTINMILLAVAVPLNVLLVQGYGMNGGAAANLLLFVVYLFLGAWMTHRKLLMGIGWTWLTRDVCVPLVVSLCVGMMGKLLLANFAWPGGMKVGLACILLVVAWGMSIASAPRAMIFQLLHWRRTQLTI